MKCLCSIATWLLFTAQLLLRQSIQHIDGSLTTKDTLNSQIECLMKNANVTGLGISVFNNNQPVFVKTFGYSRDFKNFVKTHTSNVRCVIQ